MYSPSPKGRSVLPRSSSVLIGISLTNTDDFVILMDMIIGIEAERANNPVKTGVEHYAQQLILQFAEIDTENQYILYLRTEPEEWIKRLPKNFSYRVMPFPIFWTQLRLSWEMLFHKPDVLFVPASSMPIIHPRKTVVTVHDLAFMFYPETYTTFMRYFHMFEDVLVSQLAWKIITVSESTKHDFIRFWKTDEKRIHVVHHGFTPQIKNREKRVEHSAMQLPEKFALFLSTVQPRKNLSGLIAAFRAYKQKHPEDPHKLVVAGKVGWKAEGILQEIERNKDVVVYLNHVTDGERALLYEKASVLAMPSLYEGFGMWILEAFDAGVPVITSNISSMPEVAGEAAEYCDPADTNSIVAALEKVLLDKEYAAGLIVKGSNRLKEFSWRKCAEETLDVLKA